MYDFRRLNCRAILEDLYNKYHSELYFKQSIMVARVNNGRPCFLIVAGPSNRLVGIHVNEGKRHDGH